MFISFKYKDYNIYKIIDTDFQDVTSVESLTHGSSIAVIDIYEKRNLPVAANLALLFQYNHRKHGEKISNLIKWNKLHNPKYLKYADEVEKYIIWM